MPKNTQKCQCCQKRLRVIDRMLPCKCSYHFCRRCRSPMVHGCSFDAATEARTRLKEELEKAKAEFPKVDII